MPIKMVTALNIESYVKEYAGGGGGGDEPTVPPDLPAKSNLFLGNTFTWGMLPWVVVHVDNAAQECYLAVGDEMAKSGRLDFSKLNAQNNAIATVYLTEGQRAALKYIVAGTTSGRLFSPTEEQVVSTFDYYRTSKSNRIWGESRWWTSTATKYVNVNGDITQSGGDGANARPHCCIDMSLYDSQEGGGSELNPELPDMSSLTVGNTVMFADREWVVSHRTSSGAYLTLKSTIAQCAWDGLQNACTTFAANSLTEAQRGCLKSVTAGNTSGKVFVATYEQMNGGFSYFGSNSRRSINTFYWTSTEQASAIAWYVQTDGSFGNFPGGAVSNDYGCRPSVCIDLTLYNT